MPGQQLLSPSEPHARHDYPKVDVAGPKLKRVKELSENELFKHVARTEKAPIYTEEGACKELKRRINSEFDLELLKDIMHVYYQYKRPALKSLAVLVKMKLRDSGYNLKEEKQVPKEDKEFDLTIDDWGRLEAGR